MCVLCYMCVMCVLCYMCVVCVCVCGRARACVHPCNNSDTSTPILYTLVSVMTLFLVASIRLYITDTLYDIFNHFLIMVE